MQQTATMTKTRARSAAFALVLALVSAGAGYVGGRVHGWSAQREKQAQLDVAQQEHQKARDSERSKHAAAVSALQAELTAASERVARGERVLALYEGYRSVQLALSSLDARNFGIAQAQLREAERVLAEEASTRTEVAQVLASLSGVNITVASNLSEQRARVASLLARLDAILASEQAAHDPAQAADAENGLPRALGARDGHVQAAAITGQPSAAR